MKPALLAAVIASGCLVLNAAPNEAPAVFTAAQANAGRVAYESTCIKCHTATLGGRIGAPGELPPLDSLSAVMRQTVDNANGNVPPLAGAAFMAKWGPKTTQELSRRVREAVGGFRTEHATEDTYLDLTAYFLQVSGAHAGTQLLTSATAVGLSYVAVAPQNLIVCDEVPAMEVLSGQIQQRLKETSEIVSQDKLPPNLSSYKNVIVYIHRDLNEPAELAFIDYAKNGGNLVLLHHSISSGKRKNKYWFPFLGIQLPPEYRYIDDATWDMVPMHGAPPFTMKDTEVYVNQLPDENRTRLFNIRYGDTTQGTGGWMKKTEKGTVYYFMPGHKATDFELEPYVQALMKALK